VIGTEVEGVARGSDVGPGGGVVGAACMAISSSYPVTSVGVVLGEGGCCRALIWDNTSTADEMRELAREVKLGAPAVPPPIPAPPTPDDAVPILENALFAVRVTLET